MIPGLPNWSNTDNVSVDYVGPKVRPPLKPEWGDLACYTLGPRTHGVRDGNVAARWWAAHLITIQDAVLIYLTPATLDGSGWGVSRLLFVEHAYTKPISLSVCFDGLANVVFSYCGSEQDGRYTTNMIRHRRGDSWSVEMFHDVRRGLLVNSYPLDEEAAYPVNYFFIGEDFPRYEKDVLYHAVLYPGQRFESDMILHRKLGPTWQLVHGGYLEGKLFQLAYKHAPDDPLPALPKEVELVSEISMGMPTLDRFEIERDGEIIKPGNWGDNQVGQMPFITDMNLINALTHGSVSPLAVDVSLVSLSTKYVMKYSTVEESPLEVGVSLVALSTRSPMRYQNLTESPLEVGVSLEALSTRNPMKYQNVMEDPLEVGVSLEALKTKYVMKYSDVQEATLAVGVSLVSLSTTKV